MAQEAASQKKLHQRELISGVTLAGTLTVPDGVSLAPALLLLPGSGQADREDNLKRLPINLFPQIAQAVAELVSVTLPADGCVDGCTNEG